MNALYIVLPLALVIASLAVGAFIWTVRSGQLDDVDTPPRRILFDDAALPSGDASRPVLMLTGAGPARRAASTDRR
jgi:cbb3-type cytochrome oxidase maturation protein